MNREELIFKKRELLKQSEVFRQKAEAIDQVLALFPENTPALPGVGRYADMSVADAIIDYLSRSPGTAVTVGDIARALKAEGFESTSANFSTMVSAVGNSLVERNRLIRRTKNARKAFAVPVNGEKE